VERLHRTTVSTPLGELTIVCSAEGVIATAFDDEEPATTIDRIELAMEAPVVRGGGATRSARRDAERYLAGRARTLTVPADLSLVPDGFGRRVLETTTTIPYGELWTYGDVAGMAGAPRAARAAGSALARCPIELFVPCHRVVHASGALGGYGRHEDRKRWLLRHEGAIA
jgi:methylated-DNA-[protein]-cysteine S-methyltransferase